MFPKIGVPQNGWFIVENPIEMDVFGGTPIFGNTHLLKFDKYAQLPPNLNHFVDAEAWEPQFELPRLLLVLKTGIFKGKKPW